MRFLAETAILKNRTSLEGVWVNKLKQYKQNVMESNFCNLCDNLPLPPKQHSPVWELCKTSDSTTPVPCDHGSCVTTELTKL